MKLAMNDHQQSAYLCQGPNQIYIYIYVIRNFVHEYLLL